MTDYTRTCRLASFRPVKAAAKPGSAMDLALWFAERGRRRRFVRGNAVNARSSREFLVYPTQTIHCSFSQLIIGRKHTVHGNLVVELSVDVGEDWTLPCRGTVQIMITLIAADAESGNAPDHGKI